MVGRVAGPRWSRWALRRPSRDCRRAGWCQRGRAGSGGRAVRSTRTPRARSSGSATRSGSSSDGGSGTARRGWRCGWGRTVVGTLPRPRGRTRRCGRRRRVGRVGCTRGTRTSRSRRMTCSRTRSGTSYAGVDSWALRSITGLTVILVRESAHQSLTWSSSTRRWPSSIRPVGPNTVDSPSMGGVEVGVEDDLARGGKPVGVAGAGGAVRRGGRARSGCERGRRGPSARRAPSGSLRSRAPSSVSAPWARARSRSRASAMSSSASIRIVPAKCTSSSWIVAWRGST